MRHFTTLLTLLAALPLLHGCGQGERPDEGVQSLILNINSAQVIIGLLIGGLLPFLFSATRK